MKSLVLFVGLLFLVNCGQDAKTPVTPTQPEGPAEFDSLTKLVAWGRGIASLTGIDSLKNLQVLDLADNQAQNLSPRA